MEQQVIKTISYTEESPLRPISQYAIEKVGIEKETTQHPNAISFRLATVFEQGLHVCELTY